MKENKPKFNIIKITFPCGRQEYYRELQFNSSLPRLNFIEIRAKINKPKHINETIKYLVENKSCLE